MKLAEAKKAVKNLFIEKLANRKYKSDCDSQGCSFHKETPENSEMLGYSVSNFHYYFMSGGFVGIGVKKIDKIICYLEEQKYFFEKNCTLIASVSDYVNQLNFKFKIETEEDILKYSVFIDGFFKDFAIPFFEKFSTVDAIDKHLNNDLEDLMPKYCNNLAKKITAGLIAAKLNNNPKYNEIRDNYNEKVEKFMQGYIRYEPCKKVIEFLDNYTSEKLNTFVDGL